MTPSAKCEALIKSFETCARKIPDGRFHAYMPTPNDVWTCGWGTTRGVTANTIWSQDECDRHFRDDLKTFGIGVMAALTDAPTTQNQFDACVSLAYNIGLRNFANSSVLRKHKAGDYDGAADAFRMWVKQAGVTLNGLVRRRLAERKLYLGES